MQDKGLCVTGQLAGERDATITEVCTYRSDLKCVEAMRHRLTLLLIVDCNRKDWKAVQAGPGVVREVELTVQLLHHGECHFHEQCALTDLQLASQLLSSPSLRSHDI